MQNDSGQSFKAHSIHYRPLPVQNFHITQGAHPFVIRYLGQRPYLEVLEAMQQFTYRRHYDTPDEIWFVEHYSVYTLGKRAKDVDVPQSTKIPIIASDRGGQITYHGPGQLIMYPLLNLARLNCHLRQLVDAIEKAIICLLEDHGITSYAQRTAPGVYIQKKKIASLGLRVRKDHSYHGLAINVDMDLTPFQSIDPCGYKSLQMTQLVDWAGPITLTTVSERLLRHFVQQLFKNTIDTLV